jgi:AraC family transcriptional regulator
VKTPDRSTAAAFPRYLTGEVVVDSVALQWPGLYARRWPESTTQTQAYSGGLPIRQLRKVQDFVTEHLAEEISIERLAELVELSSSHFSHVFKETTGMTPLQFVTRERITRAQQMIRECPAPRRSSKRGALTAQPPERQTSRSLIEIGLEVGYTSPSHFAQVFPRVVGVTPTEFRSAL